MERDGGGAECVRTHEIGNVVLWSFSPLAMYNYYYYYYQTYQVTIPPNCVLATTTAAFTSSPPSAGRSVYSLVYCTSMPDCPVSAQRLGR